MLQTGEVYSGSELNSAGHRTPGPTLPTRALFYIQYIVLIILFVQLHHFKTLHFYVKYKQHSIFLNYNLATEYFERYLKG